MKVYFTLVKVKHITKKRTALVLQNSKNVPSKSDFITLRSHFVRLKRERGREGDGKDVLFTENLLPSPVTRVVGCDERNSGRMSLVYRTTPGTTHHFPLKTYDPREVHRSTQVLPPPYTRRYRWTVCTDVWLGCKVCPSLRLRSQGLLKRIRSSGMSRELNEDSAPSFK